MFLAYILEDFSFSKLILIYVCYYACLIILSSSCVSINNSVLSFMWKLTLITFTETVVNARDGIKYCKKWKKSQQIRQIHVLFLGTFRTCFFSPFSHFNGERLRYKCYNKQSTTHDNCNNQSHETKKKLNQTIPFSRTVVLMQL